MQNIHQAIAALGEAIGLFDAALDEAGNMTLIVDGGLDVNVAQRGETGVEFWTRLPDLGSPADAAFLAHLLASNHLGEGTGAARFALTPDRSAVVFCERVETAGLDGQALAARLAEFIRYASFWRSAEGRQAASAAGGRAPLPEGGDSAFLIRA